MARTFEQIDESLQAFLQRQQMFFVATAPLSEVGHINLSPKGLDDLAVLGPRTVAYLDLTGSGAETIAHLRENGRIVLLFCAFEGAPKIVRLHGKGRVIEVGTSEFESLAPRFRSFPGVRSIIHIELDRISDSCGYGVPLYRYEGQRSQLVEWAERKGDEAIVQYREKNNVRSIDGLPALTKDD